MGNTNLGGDELVDCTFTIMEDIVYFHGESLNDPSFGSYIHNSIIFCSCRVGCSGSMLISVPVPPAGSQGAPRLDEIYVFSEFWGVAFSLGVENLQREVSNRQPDQMPRPSLEQRFCSELPPDVLAHHVSNAEPSRQQRKLVSAARICKSDVRIPETESLSVPVELH